MTRIKICGITTVAQALACADLGVDALGVNLIPASPRRIDLALAEAIVGAIRDKALVVAVVADLTADAMRSVREATQVGCLQLHGDEAPDTVAALLPHAYKAVGVANAADAARAGAMPGEFVMVDAKVEGVLGGTGRRVDPGLIKKLSAERRVILAGGLNPSNVAQAISEVTPWCVDVASGVERSPGVKDLEKVRAFVAAVRQADHKARLH